MMNNTLPKPSRGRIILAGLVGNVMEWYDFAVYGFFASVIGHQFFPSDNPTVSLIAAFAAFAAGFLVRPLGGLLFGRIGDLVGRSRALTLSVLTMAIPTVIIGLLPTHQSIGLAAPVLLVTLRLIQGLSVGGEYTSSLVVLSGECPAGSKSLQRHLGGMGGHRRYSSRFRSGCPPHQYSHRLASGDLGLASSVPHGGLSGWDRISRTAKHPYR